MSKPFNLKRLAEKKYLLIQDESAEILQQEDADRLWLTRVSCKFGHIGIHSATLLYGYSASYMLFGKITAIPDLKVIQRGDREIGFTFPPARLDDVAKVLRARIRPRVSDEERERRRVFMLENVRPKLGSNSI